MPQYATVTLARLVRETRTVVVEVQGQLDLHNEGLQDRLTAKLWDSDDVDEDWDVDVEWGCEPGTHSVSVEPRRPMQEPDFVASFDPEQGRLVVTPKR